MSSVNKAVIVGRVGQDPEVRHSTSGMAIVNLSLATSIEILKTDSSKKSDWESWFPVCKSPIHGDWLTLLPIGIF